MYKLTAIVFLFCIPYLSLSSCSGENTAITGTSKEKITSKTETLSSPSSDKIITGAEQLDEYIKILKNKKVALVVNQTSVVGTTHLVDTLLSLNIKIQKIFSPEHGFRGDADAGEKVTNETDAKTGLPIVSLYGNNKKPSKESLSDVDIVIFDIQDVGVRFFTYISTMHYIMEACAENNKKVIVLDRPNPNGNYVDGPVLDMKFKSFIGMHPIPIVHGLTVGELAHMINGEKWLDSGRTCDLHVVKVKNYDHKKKYSLPIKPSPNLPNDLSIQFYPYLCLFEGTSLSVGRGTEFPFQVVGHPNKSYGTFQFTPKSIPGMAKNPLHENKVCYGVDLRSLNPEKGLSLQLILDLYKKSPEKDKFFLANNFFNKLAGNSLLQQQIKDGLTESEIRKSWEKELSSYKTMRKKYLLYPDFE